MKMTSLVLVVAAFGCSGGGGEDLADRDPRCVAACTDDPPQIDGAGDVCNTDSRVQCLDECEARIAGVTTVCANCLVEDACFDPGGCDDRGVQIADCNSSGQCTITGRVGSCTYPMGNQTALENCERQVDPRREVACTAKFQATSACASSCN